MNHTKYNAPNRFSNNQNRDLLERILNVFSITRAMLDSDVSLRFTSDHNENLPIIYANIRV